jgi:XTP/dITP diphosphohydrolase
MKTDLLIATGNKGKYNEFIQYLGNSQFNLISLENYNIVEPEENGDSYTENALIKAKYYCKKTNLISLSDDSGLSIDQLNGEPGIYSARWAGENKDFNTAIEVIKKKLLENNIDLDNVTGSFHCSLILYRPDNSYEEFYGKVDGKITFPSRGDNGFGYDPIFIPNGYKNTFSEMDKQTKLLLSHRYQAIIKLKNHINHLL